VQILDVICTFITGMSDDEFFSLANIRRTAASRRRKGTIMTKLSFAALAACACLYCGNASAASMVSEPLDHPPSVVVHFYDLDLKKDADAQELLDRITYAARRACGPRPGAAGLHLIDRWDDCVNDAMNHAIAHVNSPTLNRVAGITAGHAHIAAAEH
jgi:UrcA family protein